MKVSISLLMVLALVIVTCSAQDECDEPTESQLEDVIGQIIRAGANPAEPTIVVSDYNIVCRAFGEERDHLRLVSVVVEYTCDDNIGCPPGTAVEQIETECNNGNWTNNVGGGTADVRLETPLATLTTDSDNCAFCFSPAKAAASGAGTSDEVTHCIACDPSCVGLMGCYDLGSDSCCNYYSNSQCVEICPNPFIENDDYDCVCPVGTTGFNCSEAVDCGPLTDPTNGKVALTGTEYESFALYNCDPGYSLNGVNRRICQADGLWSDTEPTCTENDCGPLDKPDNGDVSFSNEYAVDSVAIYTCDADYTLTGNANRTCQNSGVWSGIEPTCVKECQVVDCVLCEKDATMCDACSGDKFYDSAEQECVVGRTDEQCESCEDQTPAIIALAILFAIAIIVIIILVCILIYLMYKSHTGKVTPHHELKPL